MGMKKMKQFMFLLYTVFLIFSCKNESDCEKLPAKFSSGEDLVNFIKDKKFAYSDSIKISNEKFLTAASYLSCDGESGYFIYTRHGIKEYFRSKVPIAIWNEFKVSQKKDDFFFQKIDPYYRSGLTISVNLDSLNHQ
jgi:hypothetical protein